MNPLQKKLFEKKYGHVPSENPPTTQTQTDPPQTETTKPIFKQIETPTSHQQTQPTLNYSQPSAPVYNIQQRQANLEKIAQFNSSKLAIRFSSDFFPMSKKTQKSSHIPFSAMIQPYASVYNPEEFPTTTFGSSNPVIRCDDCRGYLSPFTMFLDQGNKFKCNLCQAINAVPNHYFCPLDENGERTDKFNKAELCTGTFDIKAGQDYMARPPMPPIFFFIFDVSPKGTENGSIEMACSILIELINGEQGAWGDSRTKMGFIVYDSNVNILELTPNQKMPKMVTVTDIDSLQKLPIPENLLVNLQDCKAVILQFLASLPKMFANSKENGTALTDALRIASSILRLPGGRIYIMQSNPNLIQERSLVVKSTPKPDDKGNVSSLLPSSSDIMSLTPDMQQNFVSCAIFVFSSGYKNFITLGELARYLNGDVHYYVDGPERNNRFYFEFKHSLMREYTWESVFRIRISSGWKIGPILGNYSIKSSGDLLSLPNLTDSQALIYELILDDEIARNDVFHLQTALLYTTQQGERRIRVINYAVPLTDNLKEIHSVLDPQVMACTLMRQGLLKLYHAPSIPATRKFLLDKTNAIVNEVSPRMNKNQPLSDSMSSFTLYMLGILKHSLFLEKNLDLSKENDIKNYMRIRLAMLNIEETSLYFVPYLFAIHNLANEDTAVYGEDGVFVFPQLQSLSMNSLDNQGIYLMDDGYQLFMLVGSNVDSNIMMNLFGIRSIGDVDKLTEDHLYHNSNDALVTKVYHLITELRARKLEKYAYLHIIREGERSPSEFEFYSKLIEDKMNIPQSYNVSYKDFVELVSMPPISGKQQYQFSQYMSYISYHT